MRPRPATTRALLLALALAAPAGAIAQDAPKKSTFPELASAIDARLADSRLGTTRVGIHAVDMDTGDVLYARDAKGAYNPASNVKLFTAACGLDSFGPAHQFRTDVFAEGLSADGATVEGNLTVRGEGSSYLFYKHTLEWAAALKNRGVRRITGDLVIDDTAFGQDAYLPPGFEQKPEPNSFRAPIGAVSINLNAVRVVISPGAKAGDQARVRLVPPNDHVRVLVEATTTAGAKRRLEVDSTGTNGGTTITVAGSIGAESRDLSVVRRIDEPAKFAGAVIARAIRDMGIEFKGKVRRGLAPKGGTIVVTHASEPMAYLMAVMNKWSSNFMAEMTLRALSTTKDAGDDKGTWAGGKRALDVCLKRLGVDTAGIAMLNGSGLYTGNEYSPAHVTSLLSAMDRHRWAPEFKASLAIAGVDGTLAGRFKKTSAAGNLRAKTGTLNEVTALSGYVTTKKGRRVALSILFNDTPIKSWRLRDIQDGVARAIADSVE